MYDIERINSMIDDILRFFKDLESVGLNESTIKNPKERHASAMLILGIMNRAIDIAEEILVKNDIPMPRSYSEGFPALANAGLLDKKLATQIESLIEHRGLFAHHYYDIHEKKVLQLAKEIYIIKTFIEEVKELVRKAHKRER